MIWVIKMTSIGEFVKNKRLELGISQKKLGFMVELSDSEIMKIENGTRKSPNWESLCKLAKVFDISPLEILLVAGYITDEDINPQSKIRGLDKLTAKEIDEVQQYVDFVVSKSKNKGFEIKPMSFKLGELFCGPGGIAWGATNAEIENKDFSIVHQWANDYDENTCNTYRHNICPDAPETVYCGDIREFDMNQLSEIDALAFGFPCNDYSVVGEQKGMKGEYGPLYSYGVKALKKFKPMWFVAENVSGLSSANDGKAFEKILLELKSAGYVITPHLYKFEEYGVPQARHRIIIVGIRKDIDVKFKVPSTEPYKHLDNTCKNAIENPPIPSDAFNNEPTKQSEIVVKRLMCIKPGENAFTANIPEELQLKVKGAKISQIYKRLDPSKPSYTVTGSGGGGTHIYHWEEPRALTNRERARLQTFPDTYEFIGTKEGVRKQIGMAVPCKGAKIIFESILKCFAGIDYPSIESNIEY